MNTISGFPRLSGEYVRGYTKAIKDIINVFQYVNNELKDNHIKMNYDWVEKILKCCLENREKIRDDWNGFIRTNKSENGKRNVVEWYDCKE